MAPFKLRYVLSMGETQSLRVFLMSRLQPWRWQPLLDAGAISVETRDGPVKKLTLSYQLSAGEVVVIDDGPPDVERTLRGVATSNFKDYVFCLERTGDDFLTQQVVALTLDGSCIDIGDTLKDLQALVADMQSFVTAPWRYLIVVSHASDAGDILLKMRPEKSKTDWNALAITMESLNEAMAAKALEIPAHARKPVFMPRPEVGGKPMPRALLIRGCTSGRHQAFLDKLHAAFGGGFDTVVMPKFFDACNYVGGTSKDNAKGIVEYFMHNFIVTSPTKLTRDQVIAALQAKKFKDWLGNSMADSEWSSLVPQNVDPGGAQAVKEVSVTVDGLKTPGKFRTRFEAGNPSTRTSEMTSASKPDPAAIKAFIVKGWQTMDAFKDPEWPMWKRYDCATLDAFAALWTYEEDPAPDPKPAPGNWGVHATMFTYTVRTPLIEKNTLLARYQPIKAKGTATNKIDYNDNRIFGRAGVIDKGFAQTI